jgi:hypothetical protein
MTVFRLRGSVDFDSLDHRCLSRSQVSGTGHQSTGPEVENTELEGRTECFCPLEGESLDKPRPQGPGAVDATTVVLSLPQTDLECRSYLSGQIYSFEPFLHRRPPLVDQNCDRGNCPPSQPRLPTLCLHCRTILGKYPKLSVRFGEKYVE